ncbi:hypothetical protein DKX38_008806 [Salix brachista]|uniref:anthocyanidin 3-O-glucosyltransferase n=1 Tax=Salix brachista TaxID=2182728 RepID=A0A5N5M906_9ROSI|nr:hypothetical protein DKX38_008806 [Salix brachista]
MEKAELVFVPSPGIGHLASMVELAKVLVDRDNRVSITVIIIRLALDSKISKFTESLTGNSISTHIQFIDLPSDKTNASNDHPSKFVTSLIESQKPHVKEFVSKLITQSELNLKPPRLACFVLDMFCTGMIDVANEFGVPSYIYFTSSAAFLGFQFHMQDLHDKQKVDLTELRDVDAEFEIPTLMNPLPLKIFPSVMLSKDTLPVVLHHVRRFREARGIILNTFEELESDAVKCLCNGENPTVYPVGPILNLKGHAQDVGSDGSSSYKDIMLWLDDQPPSSVVFLCFGSLGSFNDDQVKEIARALEHSGHRFLWSLRKSPSEGKIDFLVDHEYLQQVFPDGFLDRTEKIGKVIGWAPQVDVLAHPSIKEFISHCGWNSILESVWFGVPVATWPMYAEQQFNAFEVVIELGLAVEIKMDYRREFLIGNEIVLDAKEIERAIKSGMEHDGRKLGRLSEKSREAVMDGGSSSSSLTHLINDMMIVAAENIFII